MQPNKKISTKNVIWTIIIILVVVFVILGIANMGPYINTAYENVDANSQTAQVSNSVPPSTGSTNTFGGTIGKGAGQIVGGVVGGVGTIFGGIFGGFKKGFNEGRTNAPSIRKVSAPIVKPITATSTPSVKR